VSYRVALLPSAAKEFDRLPGEVKGRVRRALAALATDPRPHGSRKLAGGHDYHRIRVGAYRVLYEIRDQDLLVLVIAIGHRREVYR
jgi:mRNA interferase RelE/StbE